MIAKAHQQLRKAIFQRLQENNIDAVIVPRQNDKLPIVILGPMSTTDTRASECTEINATIDILAVSEKSFQEAAELLERVEKSLTTYNQSDKKYLCLDDLGVSDQVITSSYDDVFSGQDKENELGFTITTTWSFLLTAC